jgi:hypothetical protein
MDIPKSTTKPPTVLSPRKSSVALFVMVKLYIIGMKTNTTTIPIILWFSHHSRLMPKHHNELRWFISEIKKIEEGGDAE